MGGSAKKTFCMRLATKADVPTLKLLIEGLAKFEKQSDHCHAKEAALESTLFCQPPFLGPTVLLLELASSLTSSPPSSSADEPSDDVFQEKFEDLSISTELEDPSGVTFKSAKDGSRIVVGFVLFFPNYSTFLAKPGLYIGDFYVRKEYRRQGLGTVLLKTVAQQAVLRGLGRVEWCVMDWNVNAVKFYEAMGAIVHQEWRVCRLAGDALQTYGA